MPHLRISLFGAPLIEFNDVPIEIRRRKVIALLAYLAVTNQHHARDTLATLLWPNYSQANARAALRQVLSSVKAALGDNWLQTDRDMVTLNQNESSWVDVNEFHRLITECQTHQHENESACPHCIGLLTNAVDIYRDDFMAGFTLPNSANFDAWQSFQTDKLRQEIASALERLVKGCSAAQNFQTALQYAQQWLTMDPFHEAAHRYVMQLYAWSDQRAAALRQYEACQQALNELGVSPEATTVALYMAIREGQLSSSGSQLTRPSEISWSLRQSLRTPSHNLPLKQTSFLAREAELTQIAGLLADPACRLLTLTGLGGIGKTRLALEAAEDQLNCFAQGVFYVALAPLNSLDLLLQAIASALRFTPHGSEDLKAQLFRILCEKELLLVLDNFEHLLAEAILISELLAAAPHVKILTTSREPLALREEWLMRLEGMPYPDSEAADGIETYGAIQLFVQSARRVQASFSLARELPSIVHVCKLLEGLPLGIELAAGNLYTMPCRQIAEQIEHNIDVLTTSLRNIPERHRSLRAVFEHSWNLLTAPEQNTLMKLCEFRGGFTLKAATEVADTSPTTLRSLVEKSLIDVDPAGRYDMHEMLRQFAEDKLVTSGEQAPVRLRHLDYFCKLAETAEPRLQRADQLDWLKRLDQEQGNLHAALQGAIERQNSEMALRLVGALWRYWGVRIPLSEGRRSMTQALAISGGDSLARAQALLGIGTLARLQGDYQAAQAHYIEALELFRQLDIRQGVANIFINQGVVAYKQGDFRQGKALLEEGLGLFRALNDPPGIAFALHSLAALTNDKGGEVETVMRLYSEALSIRKTLGDKQGIANTVHSLGIVAHDAGDLATARTHYQASLDLVNELGDQRMAANVLYNLANIANKEGDHVTARSLLEDCLAIRNQLGDRRGRAFLLIALAIIAIAQSDPQGATVLYKESLTFFHEAGEKRTLVYILQGLTETACASGKASRAARLLGAADGLCTAIGFVWPPVDQLDYEHGMATVREQLGEAVFLQEYNAGLAMPLDDAIAFALT